LTTFDNPQRRSERRLLARVTVAWFSVPRCGVAGGNADRRPTDVVVATSSHVMQGISLLTCGISLLMCGFSHGGVARTGTTPDDDDDLPSARLEHFLLLTEFSKSK